MVKRLLIFLFITFYTLGRSQCPQIYDGLGTATTDAQFVNCISGDYTINFQFVSSFTGAYSIVWGDGSPNTVGVGYVAGNTIPHTYTNTIGTFTMTYSIPSASCSHTALVVMERPVSSSIQIPIGGVTQACAPKTLTFTNSSTNVSSTTTFTWDFGDGSPIVTYNSTNAGQNVTHSYLKGTVNCQTQVTLKALNYCRFSNPSAANYNPIQIYDIDDAAIAADKSIRCFPDNQFTFTNVTNRNCVPEGNTFQRQERWNLGNYWGYGHDSIIDWHPWPPTTPLTVAFPSVVGSYTVLLLDSNFCGVDQQVLSVSIVNAPVAGVVAPSGNICQNSSLTFTNTSSTGYSYQWNFGDGAGFQSLGSGNKSHTYTTPGVYTVQVQASLGTGGGACTDVAQVLINVLASPTSNFSLTPTAGCNSLTNVTFTNLSSGASTYTWSFANGNTSNLVTPPPQSYTNAGGYTASLVVTGTTSCVNIKTATLIVRPNPVANFPAISPCVGAAGSFSSTSTVTGTNAINSYTWDFGDGTAVSNALNPSHTYSTPATYTVKLIAATAFCADTIFKNVVVNIKPTADFAITPTVNCPPFAATFTNTSSNATNYLWRYGTVPSATSAITNGAYTYTNNTQSFLDYTVTLIASTGLGCADSIKKPISVKPKPVPIFSMGTSGGCSPLLTTFTNNSIGATTYSWNFGDGNSSTTMTPVYSFTNISVLLYTNTVTLIATNSVSCTDSVKHTLQIYPQPLTTFTMNPGSGCTPLTINFPSVPGIVSYTWSFGDNSTPITASSPTVHVFTNTTTANKVFTVELIASNAFGCIDSSFKYPLIYPKPVPGFAMTPTLGCSPLSTTLTNASSLASTYLWRFGDGTPTTTAVSPTHTYTNPGNSANHLFTSTLVATTVNGCQDSITKDVLVYYKPLASFAQNNPQCTSTTFSFTNNSTGTTTASWVFGDASPTVTLLNPSHTYTDNTINNLNFTVQLVATTSNTCRDTAYGYPVVYAHPVANYALSPGIGCSLLSNTMTNVSLYAQTYMWRYGDNTSTVTTTNATHIYTNTSNTANQTFTCTLTAYNSNGCKDSIKETVTVYYKPLASFITNTPGCTSDVFTFSNTSIGTSTPSWTFGDNSTSTLTSVSHTYTNTTLNNINYTVQLVVTTPNSCRDTARSHPVVYSLPEAHFVISPTVGCSPLHSNFTSSSLRANTYLWKFGDAATATASTTSHTYTNTSNVANQIFTCTLIAFNNNGCKDSIKQPMSVFYKPRAIFSETDPQCLSQTITFSNTSIGAAANTWTFGDGTPVSTSVSPVHAYTNTTINNINYTVQLVVSSASLCTDTAYGYPQIYAHPVAGFALTPTIGCSPLHTILSNLSSAAHTYKWKFGDGLTSPLQATTHDYFNASNTTDQTFTCTLVAFNNNGCRDSANAPLYVYYKPKSVFSLDTPACTPKLITFTNTSIGANSYNWDFNDGGTSTNINPLHQFVNNTPFNQTFSVSLISASPSNCKDTLIVPMVVHPHPRFFISSQPDSGCSPLTVFFPQLAGVSSYVWIYNDNVGFGNTGNIYNTFINDGNTAKTYNIKLIARDIYTCPDTPTTVVKVFPRPKAKFSANPLSVYIPNEYTYMTNLSSGASTYSWSFGDGGESNDFEPSHLYTLPGDFQIVLMVSNNYGCRDTFDLDQPVKALAETTVQIPNAFTPQASGSPGTFYTEESDRHNFIFHPNVKGADKYELSVYSRWGELLFDTKDPQEGWDGYYKGQMCTEDVYIWKVVATFVDGKTYKKTGDLLLLR